MSIPNLPVDFKDDILASSNTKRKYRQTENDDSTVSFEDVTNYSQEGSEFGAKEVNQTNTAINNIYDERILDLDELELVTEPGFFVDAQAVKEAHDSLNSKITPLTNNASRQAAQPFAAGQKYYFDEDGWIYFECQMTNANGYCRFRIFNESDAEIFGFQANATATQQVAIQSGVYPVKKGWYTQLGQYRNAISQKFYFIKP